MEEDEQDQVVSIDQSTDGQANHEISANRPSNIRDSRLSYFHNNTRGREIEMTVGATEMVANPMLN